MLKEPEIKLFGRKISLPENGATVTAGELWSESSNESGDCDRCSHESRGNGEEVGREEKKEQTDEDLAEGEVYEPSEENDDQNPSQNTNSPSDSQNPSQNTNSPSESDDNRKTPPTDDDDQLKCENEENGAANSQQKSLKKPDKILPCPRCNSMDTKFCYYNNYNVNQPRHFCKSCQRYWTAGGTMRNVPVGAGRRKNKNSASHCGHITISEALQAARMDTPNGFHNLKFKPNGTVLSFGSDLPCCEPMPAALNLAERRAPNTAANGHYKNGEKEKADDCSTGPSPTMSNPPMENGFQQPAMPNMNGFPCIPGVPWPFPWNSAVPLPTIFPPGYPVPYYLWNTGGWNLPWVSPAASEKTAATSPTSPLGKHSRSNEVVNAETAEDREVQRRKSSIVIPKTLRIDDPEEAARSSIWSTLGIKYDSMSSGDGLFKAFQPKGGDAKKQAMAAAASPLMQANPAALSRSVTFRETA